MDREHGNKDSGSLFDHLTRKTVDYTKDEKPARPTPGKTVKALVTKEKKPKRPEPAKTVKVLKQPAEKTAEAPQQVQDSGVAKQPGKDAVPQPYGDDRSVFARVGRDLLNRLPEGKSVFDVLKDAKAPEKKGKGRDR